MTFYLLKYMDENGRVEILRPSEFVTVAGVRIGTTTNIVTTDGPNPISGYIDSLSGELATVSGDLLDWIFAVSGASSLRDDQQDLAQAAYAAARAAERSADLLAQDARDDAQDVAIQGVSSASDDRDDLLQDQIDDILADRPQEERFEAVSGQQLFSLSYIEYDVEYDVVDMWVRKNGVVMAQCTVSGSVSGVDWEKYGVNQIRWLYPLKDGDKVIARRERTGGGGVGGGGGDFDIGNLVAAPAPAVPGGLTLGTLTQPFSGIYLYDSVSGGTWFVQVSGGGLQIDEV